MELVGEAAQLRDLAMRQMAVGEEAGGPLHAAAQEVASGGVARITLDQEHRACASALPSAGGWDRPLKVHALGRRCVVVRRGRRHFHDRVPAKGARPRANFGGPGCARHPPRSWRAGGPIFPGRGTSRLPSSRRESAAFSLFRSRFESTGSVPRCTPGFPWSRRTRAQRERRLGLSAISSVREDWAERTKAWPVLGEKSVRKVGSVSGMAAGGAPGFSQARARRRPPKPGG